MTRPRKPVLATRADVARLRMHNERLIGTPFAKPDDAVRWLGAVQAQDYPGAKWAVAQRVKACTDADVERAFDDGAILRTHVMRPTWHFVMPEDIRWMLELTAPRVNAAMSYYDQRLELDLAVYRRSNAAIARALRGGNHLTRKELGFVLDRARIVARGQRLGHLMMRAELDAVVCSGPRRGKQFTYALLDERVPPAKTLTRERGMIELAARYFTSHGPATVRDFAWWSGLRVVDAKGAIESLGARIASTAIEGKTYWFVPGKAAARLDDPTIHLLPNYDEFLIAYQDHAISVDPELGGRARGGIFDNYIIVLNGRVAGGWRRRSAGGETIIETELLVRLNEPQRSALRLAAERYASFLGSPVTLAHRHGGDLGTDRAARR
jgi:hypothetical protein